MKKFLSAFLVLTLLFTCVACGKTEPTNTDSTTTTEATTESTTKYTTDGETTTESISEKENTTKEESTTKSEKEDTTKKNTTTTEKASSTKKPENNTTVKPNTNPTTTQKPSTTEKTTQKPSTTEKPYFVSLELISIERAEKFNIDGMHALDRIYGKNQCFQYGDTVKFRVNMSDGGTGFSVYEKDSCTTSVSGNIITAKITACHGSSFLLQIKTKDKDGKTIKPYMRYKIWTFEDIDDDSVVREYARNKGLTLLNGCSEEAVKRYSVKIPGNSNWLSQALASIDNARSLGCTRYTYQIVYQDAFTMSAYK